MNQKNNDKFQIEIFKQILWIMGFVAVTNIVGNFFTGYPLSANIKWVVVIIAAYIMDEYGINSKRRESNMFILIVILVYTIFPLGWYNSGLVSNNSLAYMFLFIIGSTILFDGVKRLFLLLSVGALFMVFMSIENFYPQFLPVYDPVILFRDRMIQVPLALLITSSMLIQFSNTLKSRHEAIEVLSDEFRDLAYTDALTGLRNRAFIFEKIAELISDDCVFYTLMLDIDEFKQVNDTYGHIEGDGLLMKVAQILREHLPRESHIARYGGDEFIIVMSENVKITSKVDQFLEAVRRDEEVIKYGVTISGGYGRYEPGLSLDEYLGEVDKTLYAAKRSGKNQILESKGNYDER